MRPLGREILKELIETNTTLSSGNTTQASERMAARLDRGRLPARGRRRGRRPRPPQEPGGPAARPRRRPAGAVLRAPRRGRGPPRGLVDGSVRPHRARRLVLRPRHARREGRRGHAGDGLLLAAPARRRSGARFDPCAHRRRRRRSEQRHPVAAREPARSHRRGLRDQPRLGRPGDPRRPRLVAHRAGGGEGLRVVHADGAQPGRPQLAAGGGERDLPARRRAAAPGARMALPTRTNEITRAYFAGQAALASGADAADMRAVSVLPTDEAAARRLSATIAVLQRDAAHDLRADAARRRPCRERAAADRARHHQLPDAAGREAGRRPAGAGACRRRPADRGGADRDADAEPAVAARARRGVGHRGRRAGHLGPRADRAASWKRARRMACSCATPGCRSTASPGSPTDPEDVRAHGKDERILVRSFDEGIMFIERLVDAIGRSTVAPFRRR